jgi:hypothetical protein
LTIGENPKPFRPWFDCTNWKNSPYSKNLLRAYMSSVK